MEELLKRCVVLIGRQRSGTTVLRRTLATHPRVRDLGEVMHPAHQSGFYRHLNQTLSDDPSKGVHNQWFGLLAETLVKLTENDPPDQNYIVDIKYNMAQAFGMSFHGGQPVNTLLHQLAQRKIPIIQLIRRNKLQLLVSERGAMKTNQWELSAKDSEKKQAEVFISPVTLGLKLQQEMAQDTYFLEQTQSAPGKITLLYEEMFTEDGSFQPDIFARLAQILNIDPEDFNLEPQLLKQRGKMSETISNFPQVQRAIQVLTKEGEIPAYIADDLD